MINIREVTIDDAENLVQLIKQVETESNFMLYGSGERDIDTDKQKNQIELFSQSPHSTILVSENPYRKLVGYAYLIGSNAPKQSHVIHIVIGVLDEFTSIGIGTKLFQALEDWAINHNMTKLELTVVVDNVTAIGLYQKMGFEIEGTKKQSLLIDGKYCDEYYMGKLL